MAGRRLSSNDVSVVIALAIVVLVLLLVYVAERDQRGAEEPIVTDSAGARALAGSAVAQPALQARDGDERRAHATDGCGIETAKAGQSATEADAVVERQREAALQAILPALDARAEPRARAAALYFRATRELFDTPQTDACKSSPDSCAQPSPGRSDDRESAEALARLAANSSDPQVYAWAYHSCARVSRQVAGSCQLINALQWARLDPANAAPWLAVAQEAKRRRDAAGLDDAMFHVASAAIHDPGWGRVAAQMIEAVPDAERTSVGTWMAALAATDYETLDLPRFVEASTYCDGRALASANRRDTCDKIAALLVDRSTTLIGRTVGLGLARKLDWPAARLAGAEQERDAAYALDQRDAPRPGESITCADVRRDLSRLVEIARVGEIEVLKRRIAASGESIDVLAAESRSAARSVREADAVGAAASAASAAPGG